MDAEFQAEVVDILKNKAADTRFIEDLHCKSVNIVQFASALEDEYEVEVPFMELNKKKTFGEAAALVDEKLSM